MQHHLIKIGRPTKYNSRIPKQVISYTNSCLRNKDFPTIEGLAIKLSIGVRTIYDWEEQYLDFSQTMELLRATQRDLLIKNGLKGIYGTSFAAFLLKALHGFVDNKSVVEATQNNYMNISPDVMAEALEIMNKKDAN